MGFHCAAALVFLGAALAASACGGKLLTVPGVGPDAASLGDDASGGAGDDAPSSNGGCQGGCSSGGSSSGFVGGSSASGGSSSGGGVTCTSSLGCARGQVCCGAITMTTACQSGPCPSTPLGPIQLCTTASECLAAGDTCGPLAAAPQLPVKVCNAPTGAGNCAVTCVGCCDSSGTCTTGRNDTVCGSGGATCSDCTTQGGTCVNGSCQVPIKADAGSPACTASSCTNTCTPYFSACCKTDGTCGCQLMFPPGPCN